MVLAMVADCIRGCVIGRKILVRRLLHGCNKKIEICGG